MSALQLKIPQYLQIRIVALCVFLVFLVYSHVFIGISHKVFATQKVANKTERVAILLSAANATDRASLLYTDQMLVFMGADILSYFYIQNNMTNSESLKRFNNGSGQLTLVLDWIPLLIGAGVMAVGFLFGAQYLLIDQILVAQAEKSWSEILHKAVEAHAVDISENLENL